MKRWRQFFLMGVFIAHANAFADGWESALAKMPLAAPAAELDRSNCVSLLLDSFQPDGTVKALIFMPGATDELYFFRRAHATITNANPTLLDAVTALTNQTYIRADFHRPFLILHTTEDSLNVIANIRNQSTAEKLKKKMIPPRIIFNDADWDGVQTGIGKLMSIGLHPRKDSPGSWHFYRHNFAAAGLTDWEMLEALALAGKTTFTIHWLTADFEPDTREGAPPKLDNFPLR